MRPETSATAGVLSLLQAVRRRRARLDALLAFTAAALVFALVVSVVRSGGLDITVSVVIATTVAVSVAALVYQRRKPGRSLRAAAVVIERARPECRNVVITAEEIQRLPARASVWMAERVLSDAAKATRGLQPVHAIPAGRTVVLCALGIAAAASVVRMPLSSRASDAVVALARRAAAALPGVADAQVIVTVRPPAYVSTREMTLRDPERIEALEGSLITVRGTGTPSRSVRFGTRAIGRIGDDATIHMTARDSGYFVVEDRGERRHLIALSVTRDRLPQVHVDQPAHDLLLPDAARSIPVRITASDDLGLQRLELRYTKVSGSGEQFEFKEGSLPLRVDQTSAREWGGQGFLALPQLALAPGDSLVYRAVARDGRPGDAGVAASDTYFVEIAGPGQVALEGVEMPPDQERYALSQQMIVLRIERLRAREAAMARSRVVEETADIAAEQRAVRASFVFLLGGHVEDEEVEAEQSSEIAEGRLQNRARRDVNSAIREMTRAEQGLVAANSSVALPPARAAVEALQRAFGKSRYLLRALPGTGRIDPSRRLTGQLAAAATWRRDLLDPAPRDGDAARGVLGDLLELDTDAVDPHRLEQVAERALAVDPSSATWHSVASRLLTLREKTNTAQWRRAAVDALIADVQREAARGLVPRTVLARPVSRLRRAWEGSR